MAKLNSRVRPTRSAGAIQASATPTGVTWQGAPGYGRDWQSALFLMGVSAFAGERTFYESAEVRDARWKAAIEDGMARDPWWVAGYLKYLRDEAGIRTAAITGAAIGARWASLNKLSGWARPVIDAVLQRADEPGEFVAYWRANCAKSLPGGVQRGVADAVRRLYTERNMLKWDSDRSGYRFGDVVELIHPEPRDAGQARLFQWAIASRHGRAQVANPNALFASDREDQGWRGLPMHANRAAIMAIPPGHRADWLAQTHDVDARLRGAGMTWEALSAWLGGPLTAAFWSAQIPSMGTLALLRNLRNFDKAGISDATADAVRAKLIDPEQIRASKVLPFQVYAAYRATVENRSDRWQDTLRRAFDASTANVPELPGRTLILVDCSGSMSEAMSARGSITRMETAALFGTALAVRAENADLVRYGNQSQAVAFRKEHSVLRLATSEFPHMGGTETDKAIRENYNGHQRVILLTDEQAFLDQTRWYGYGEQPIAFNKPPLPDSVHFHVWNFAGYENAGSPAGQRHYWWGGLSDSMFGMITTVETSPGRTQAASNGGWPFERFAEPVPQGTGAVTRKP